MESKIEAYLQEEKQLRQATIEHNDSTYTLCVVDSKDDLMRHEAMTWYPSIRVWVDMEAYQAGLFFAVCTGIDDEKVFKMYSFGCEPADVADCLLNNYCEDYGCDCE